MTLDQNSKQKND